MANKLTNIGKKHGFVDGNLLLPTIDGTELLYYNHPKPKPCYLLIFVSATYDTKSIRQNKMAEKHRNKWHSGLTWLIKELGIDNPIYWLYDIEYRAWYMYVHGERCVYNFTSACIQVRILEHIYI